eukprot:g28853.t1
MDGHQEGLVESILGSDKKPVFKGGPQLSNKSNFDQWFNDVPGVNRRVNFKMDLQKTETGTYVHDNATFFPDTAVALDGLEHNFYFTLELHTTFVYKSGDEFTFRGDDDVWVFMTLGEKTFQVDSLNIPQGSAVELSFFFAERRCCGSEFRLETSITPVKGSCTIWGDPHISPFDSGLFGAEPGPPVSILTSGDYWLVEMFSSGDSGGQRKHAVPDFLPAKDGSCEDIQIQGRYGTTIYTVAGQSALLELAISGSFINNSTFIVRPTKDKMTWDNEHILPSIPSEFAKPFCRLKYLDGEQHIDDVLSGNPVKLVKAFFVRNVQLTINRWPEHIDAIITMPQQLNGQDGHCGNFNFDPSDDSKDGKLREDLDRKTDQVIMPTNKSEKILERMGTVVSPSESLFPDGAQMHAHAFAERTLADCQPQVQQKARKACEAMIHAEGSDLGPANMETCMFDYCFAGKDFAAEDAIAGEFEQVIGGNFFCADIMARRCIEAKLEDPSKRYLLVAFSLGAGPVAHGGEVRGSAPFKMRLFSSQPLGAWDEHGQLL